MSPNKTFGNKYVVIAQMTAPKSAGIAWRFTIPLESNKFTA